MRDDFHPKPASSGARMTAKSTIIEVLGAGDLLASDAIARSLIANDQVKYMLALLQEARAHAEAPSVPAADLSRERILSRLDAPWLDDVVPQARKGPGDQLRLARGAELVGLMYETVATMLACLPERERAPLDKRLTELRSAGPDGGSLTGVAIDAMTSGDRKVGDSLHILVMDAHRAINALQAATAPETIDGAMTHGLSEAGRRRVAAFMRGLNRTAPLKFDHPGLGTTATEHDGLILIQNDIGTTDAHVLVIRVDARSVNVTYTDIHPQRLAFFTSLFDGRGVTWEGAKERHSDRLDESRFLITTGTFASASEEGLDGFLDFLGSRIVFLIDWNKMRKRLRGFVGKAAGHGLLKWAADHDFGHRGLLEIGGEAALGEAVEFAAGRHLRYGQRLDQMIGEAQAVSFIREAMELASVGLQQRRSRRTILDEIKTRLRRVMDCERLAIFDIAARHVAFGNDLASGLFEATGRIGQPSGEEWAARFARRAQAWEATADHLLNEARADIKRFDRPASLANFFDRADDAVDELEEAASLVELVARLIPPPEAMQLIAELCSSALDSAQQLVRIVECAALVSRHDVRDDLDDFYAGLESIIAAEHRADRTLRALRRLLILEPGYDQARILLLSELAANLERATDAHAHAAQSLRMYLIEEVIA